MRRFKKIYPTKAFKRKQILLKKKRITKEIQEKGYTVNRNLNSYISGNYWSTKNNKALLYRSTYEFGYFYIIEHDQDVVSYAVEPFSIEYTSPIDNKTHRYIPDILIRYENDTIKLIEIKPKAQLTNPLVEAKAQAAKQYIINNNLNIEYIFITEEDIFKTPQDYTKLKEELLKDEPF